MFQDAMASGCRCDRAIFSDSVSEKVMLRRKPDGRSKDTAGQYTRGDLAALRTKRASVWQGHTEVDLAGKFRPCGVVSMGGG